MTYEELGKGVLKRSEKRVIGLFVDGIGLDRATRRINRKVDLSALIRGVTSGITPIVARYYTLIPYEDDSRQRAFLDAVTRSGLNVIVKRLPPKGVNRQVTIEIEMAADIVAFALGQSKFSELSEYIPTEDPYHGGAIPTAMPFAPRTHHDSPVSVKDGGAEEKHALDLSKRSKEQRIITVVCPGRDMAYPLSLCKELGVDTVSADFGQFIGGDVLKSAAKWIDLSDSETIWRE